LKEKGKVGRGGDGGDRGDGGDGGEWRRWRRMEERRRGPVEYFTTEVLCVIPRIFRKFLVVLNSKASR
jgi:hypothetical protein